MITYLHLEKLELIKGVTLREILCLPKDFLVSNGAVSLLSLGMAGAYITHNATRPLAILSDVWICKANGTLVNTYFLHHMRLAPQRTLCSFLPQMEYYSLDL